MVRYPACIALTSMLSCGLNRDLWEHSMRWTIVGVSITELSAWIGCVGGLIEHNLDALHDPCMIVLRS